ncbi:MAG: deoxynucleoside kinase [Bacteroidales bacterium]|nr:deoxynucleoside kinase [Bacteroidales bacterium]HOK97777.1 deoxynucleoside kinase [Bacteroidales bacterium]HPO64727.1 deoxynucleoside kinase [Bacteroidales bacterium]
MHIAIGGNIGSGKTTLAELLAKHYGWEPHFENVDDNPYLADFYADMQRWAFNLQIYFVKSRFEQILKIKKAKHTIVQDRTIYEDAYIFAPNLHDMGLISTRDYETYRGLFELMSSMVSPPDLLIYLKASVPTLVKQIQKRGRKYEASIRLDYLQKLNERYDDWIDNYKLGKKLIIDVDNHNFVENADALSFVIDKINAQLHGLF